MPQPDRFQRAIFVGLCLVQIYVRRGRLRSCRMGLPRPLKVQIWRGMCRIVMVLRGISGDGKPDPRPRGWPTEPGSSTGLRCQTGVMDSIGVAAERNRAAAWRPRRRVLSFRPDPLQT